mmetsp:Transcript_24586/g.40769  ORF Transcript_24586/g.40769 Transcript_24586/m.40769 type:complete len:250 (+) Transcript_24586:64-813(+)
MANTEGFGQMELMCGLMASVFENVRDCLDESAAILRQAALEGVAPEQIVRSRHTPRLPGTISANGSTKKLSRKRKKADGPLKVRKTSGYQLFMSAERQLMSTDGQRKDMPPNEVMKELGRRWTSLPPDDRQAWMDKAVAIDAAKADNSGDVEQHNVAEHSSVPEQRSSVPEQLAKEAGKGISKKSGKGGKKLKKKLMAAAAAAAAAEPQAAETVASADKKADKKARKEKKLERAAVAQIAAGSADAVAV